MVLTADYGRPMKPFFIEIQSEKLAREILGHLGYFPPNYQHQFWCSESVYVFHYSTIISTK
jgi:hypothetical protein